MPFDLWAETLARVQFAFTVSFHIIFPAFSIGLASYLAVLNALWLRTGESRYLVLFDYWKKIFAVAFGMGVVSGIVISYQFGTNWSVFSDKTGPILGPLMAYEVLSAFFLEAGFLGIMLFGRERVGPGLHMFATAMVAFGTLMSATWILSVNAWMHTPAGYSVNEADQFVPEDWWAIIFNPSFPYRLMHMVLAAYLTVAFVVGGVAAWHLLRGRAAPACSTRWFAPPAAFFSLAVPALVAIAAWKLFQGLIDHHDQSPFRASLAIFVLSFIGVGISFYPNIVPPSLSFWEAAAPDESLAFTLYGTVILVPLILAYTADSYWVFRGKVRPVRVITDGDTRPAETRGLVCDSVAWRCPIARDHRAAY